LPELRAALATYQLFSPIAVGVSEIDAGAS
jgi:hypothetical protein